jgi:transposase
MLRAQLSERQWSRVEAFLRSERAAGRPAYDDRKFVEAVLWWRRTGVPWRDLPSDFGPWKSCLLVDKAYDSDDLRGALAAQGCFPVIASKASRAQRLPYDKELYKARSEIECTFNLLKQARRFATRYEKPLRNYAAVVALGCALLWLRI